MDIQNPSISDYCIPKNLSACMCLLYFYTLFMLGCLLNKFDKKKTLKILIDCLFV